MSGDRRAVPALMEIAEVGLRHGRAGSKASDLRANAAIDLARIAGPEHYAAFKALADKETEVAGRVRRGAGPAAGGQGVRATTSRCYGKALGDPVAGRAPRRRPSRSAFSGDKAGDAAAAGGAEADARPWPRSATPCTRRSCSPWSASADKTCKECVEKLAQADRARREGGPPAGRARACWPRRGSPLAIIQNAERRRALKPRQGRRPPEAATERRHRRQGQGQGQGEAAPRAARKEHRPRQPPQPAPRKRGRVRWAARPTSSRARRRPSCGCRRAR